MLKRTKTSTPHDRLNIPYTLFGPELGSNNPNPPAAATTPWSDRAIYFTSLFLREFLATMCQLVISSRLGGDLFIAGPIVLLYVSIVFRRPLINPFVSTLACWSTGEWKRANVAGYPGYSKETTHWYELPLFWVWVVGAQLSAAAVAGSIRALNDSIFGYEFIKNSAWGAGQLYLRTNLTEDGSCWNKELTNTYPYTNTTWGQTMEIPVHMYKNSAVDMYRDDGCLTSIQMRWWFAEDMGAVLFLIVGYIHIWRWLRWDDMQKGNPNPRMEPFWGKIVTFSVASASLAMMTAMAFPTAHAGLHNSLFLYVYEGTSVNKHVTSNDLSEPLVRAAGGILGCIMAVLYEWVMSELDTAEKSKAGWLFTLAHKTLYISPIPEPAKDSET